MNRFLKLLAAASLAVLPFIGTAHAAATLQVSHAYICAPEPVVGASGPRRVVNTSSTASPQPSYVLNNAGCAVIAGADIGFFLSQGYYYGPNTFTIQQTGITANQTASTSTLVLPAYAVIHSIELSETAGNAITGGINIGDSQAASWYASAVALTANANVVVKDAVLTRISANSGVPTADQILIAAGSSFNSGSVNVTIVYGFDW